MKWEKKEIADLSKPRGFGWHQITRRNRTWCICCFKMCGGLPGIHWEFFYGWGLKDRVKRCVGCAKTKEGERHKPGGELQLPTLNSIRCTLITELEWEWEWEWEGEGEGSSRGERRGTTWGKEWSLGMKGVAKWPPYGLKPCSGAEDILIERVRMHERAQKYHKTTGETGARWSNRGLKLRWKEGKDGK